jgi:hypothetical protein
MEVLRDVGTGIHTYETDLRVLPPDQPRLPRAPSIRFGRVGIHHRRPLDVVEIHDDARLQRRGHALIGKRRIHAVNLLSREREVIEAHGGIHLERLPSVRARLHRSLRTRLKVDHMILRELDRLAVEIERRRSVAHDDDEFLCERLFGVYRASLHVDLLEQRSASPCGPRDYSGREGGGGQRGVLHRLAGRERQRDAHFRKLARPTGDLELIDHSAVARPPIPVHRSNNPQQTAQQ